MKRARPTSWLIAAPPDKEDYLLNSDSAKHVKPSTGVDVDFNVNVSDLGTGLNEIDLGQHLHWEIGAESVSIPNNVESFHSIDENNESIGFFTLSFAMSGTGTEDENTFQFAPHYLPHKSYSVESVLSEKRNVMRDMWLLTHKTKQGVNVVRELFSTTMFNPHINVVSGFVELESVHVDFRPLANMFEKYLHINGRPPGTTCVKLRCSFSYDLQRFLGNLKYPVGWQARNPFPVIKHGIVIDSTVFERNCDNPWCEVDFLTVKTAATTSIRGLLHVLTDLVTEDSIGKSMGNIATCKIPMDGTAIVLPPGEIRWKVLKRTDSISEFRISIVDERGELLSYKGGSLSLVLRIRPKK